MKSTSCPLYTNFQPFSDRYLLYQYVPYALTSSNSTYGMVLYGTCRMRLSTYLLSQYVPYALKHIYAPSYYHYLLSLLIIITYYLYLLLLSIAVTYYYYLLSLLITISFIFYLFLRLQPPLNIPVPVPGMHPS